jgi:Flp pilus assembly protein TadG
MSEAQSRRTTGERGAAIVEFAIVLPLLLLLVFGIIEFGRGYNVKVQLTGAVREGAREVALGGSRAEARQAVRDAAPGLNPALDDGDINITLCPPNGADGNATVRISYDLQSLTPLVPAGEIQINVQGVMRCGL